ncbi:DUF6497 family protein [Planktotalea arctica]|uniref:DUF6497 family protein n=1 Tax=Planktotalea arctica TaxID=1481893 RepID=UPI000A16D79F|nr:DUF6497 family protein [Planktotalea arctica]
MTFTARSLLVLSVVAGTAASGQMPITLPSGQSVSFVEKRVDLEADIVRLRFVAPDLASPLTRPSFEDLSADLQMLCDDFGLNVVLKDAPVPAQIVVSLSSEPVEFGVANTDVEQVFEAFSVQNGTCMLEMF